MPHRLVTLVQNSPAAPKRAALRPTASPLLLVPLFLIACKSAPTPAAQPAQPAVTYPARPTAAPSAFKIFHHANSTFTLTVPESATDEQITSLVWQLRDAARTRAFDTVHIPQKQVDADGSTVWFHIYRGPKCAPREICPRRASLRRQLPRRRRLHPRHPHQSTLAKRRPSPRRAPHQPLGPRRNLRPLTPCA